MEQARVLRTSGGDALQCFPLSKGYVNITTGTFSAPCPTMARCVSDGNIIITWNDSGTSTIACSVGDDYAFIGAKSVEVSTGTFHLAI
jgi:hypothetical protein